MLQSTGVSYDYLVTKSANHAKSYVSTYPDIKQDYEKIIIVSGDGLVHEVYQGLVSRPEDSKEALKIPIAIIPGKSNPIQNHRTTQTNTERLLTSWTKLGDLRYIQTNTDGGSRLAF